MGATLEDAHDPTLRTHLGRPAEDGTKWIMAKWIGTSWDKLSGPITWDQLGQARVHLSLSGQYADIRPVDRTPSSVQFTAWEGPADGAVLFCEPNP